VKWTHLTLLAIILLWAVSGMITDLPRIISGVPHAVDYLKGMWPPDSSILTDLWKPLLETIQIAVVGTALAAMISIPASFLSARNTAPNLTIYVLVRGTVNTLRAIPTLLWAILFVAMVGLGPLAGVFAITCHSVGALSKYMSEALESVGPNTEEVLESMRTEGASELQVLWYGLLPSVLPLFSSYILYYLEGNIRSATVLGLVGAGGIGLLLTQTVRMFKRHETLTVVLVILGVVLLADAMSRQVRKRLIDE
jgi:phosphonate transport system permease protein